MMHIHIFGCTSFYDAFKGHLSINKSNPSQFVAYPNGWIYGKFTGIQGESVPIHDDPFLRHFPEGIQ